MCLQRCKEVCEGPQLEPGMSLQHLKEHFGIEEDPDHQDSEESYFHREIYRKNYGFMLPALELLDRLVEIINQIAGPSPFVLDAGSGSGYLSKALVDLGVNSVAVDRRQVERQYLVLHQRDETGNAVEYVAMQTVQVVLLVWPSFDKPFAYEIAHAMRPGQWLLYEGEEQGGCTADDAFFSLVKGDAFSFHDEFARYLNEVHVAFAGLHDRWFVIQKR